MCAGEGKELMRCELTCPTSSEIEGNDPWQESHIQLGKEDGLRGDCLEGRYRS